MRRGALVPAGIAAAIGVLLGWLAPLGVAALVAVFAVLAALVLRVRAVEGGRDATAGGLPSAIGPLPLFALAVAIVVTVLVVALGLLWGLAAAAALVLVILALGGELG